MNATMSQAARAPSFAARHLNRGSIIKGVCADIAKRAGVAVWMPRAAFLVFGLLHWFLAVVLYIVLAKLLSPATRRLRGHLAQRETPRPDLTLMRNRFTALDARLADLETATWQQEESLRRQFRDLERG